MNFYPTTYKFMLGRKVISSDEADNYLNTYYETGLSEVPEDRGYNSNAPYDFDDVIEFGKYEDELTIRQISEQDPEYLAFLMDNVGHFNYIE